ncbi:MAG: OmpH family outer membrane protein [Candidatus Marinimicrobia bacterium]|nr:OmpH family outer membrane protein [Candidatus Neomarinimicrobiota bacterium]
MKNWKKILVLLTIALTVAVAADEIKIGFIYSEQVMMEYQGAIDAMTKLEGEAIELQKVYKEMQEDYQKLIEDYEKRKLVSSDAWKNQKQKEIISKEQQLQSYQMENFGQNGAIYKKEEEYLGPVLDKINETLKQIGEDEGYSFVFDASKGTLVYANEALDLTDRVLEELKKSK